MLDQIPHSVARLLEYAGIAVILGGTILATIRFAHRALARGWSPDRFGDAYHHFRTGLARAILLGLEFLVAADIVGTVAIEPTFRNLGVLGLIILLRTFLSFSLEVEINGHWPWQASRQAGSPEHEPL